MVLIQNACPGPVVAFVQKVIVALLALELVVLPPLPEQAVASSAVPAAIASTPATRIFLFIVETPW
jgi:hypothetical protein